MAKVMVSMPDGLLKRVDDEAKRRSMSRSALLALAASREVEQRDSEAVRQAIARSEARFKNAGSFESAELVRMDRDARS